jgi:hypothetical protein
VYRYQSEQLSAAIADRVSSKEKTSRDGISVISSFLSALVDGEKGQKGGFQDFTKLENKPP